MTSRIPALPALLPALLPLLLALPSASADEVRRTYIVQLSDKPAAAYTGGLSGLAATRPAPGSLLNPDAAPVRSYVGYLKQKQASVTAALPPGALLHEFKLVYNGFAARLTEAEALALKHSAGVASVRPDSYFQPLTNYTPTFLGLDQPGGLWSQLGGKEHAGEDIIVGVIDTGIWPENPAFADRVDASGAPTSDPSGTLAYGAPPARWRGFCQYGYGFGPGSCNNKLIGARYYNDLAPNGYELHWTEFDSARDSIAGQYGHGGHGTHTSSTVAGNGGVAANIGGAPLGQVSGIAPRARLAMYKICYTHVSSDDGQTGTNGCSVAAAVTAIEQAVFDGVDVLSYSISGITDDVDEVVEQAFLGATNAGVFVAVAAGNAGPGNTVNHPSPWLTTVGASTTDRVAGATVALSNGHSYVGASVNPVALAPVPVILAENAGSIPYDNLPGVDKDARRLCFTEADRATNGASTAGALDPALVAGKVVICQRGISARVDKGKAVKEAGGAGMVMVDDGNGIVVDAQVLPAVHVSVGDGAAIKAALVADPALRIGLSAYGIFPSPQPAPMMASFSSRGPNMATPAILKPDLTAPGVNVLAGFAPDISREAHDAIRDGAPVTDVAWTYLSGTSMATPHVAGLGALLKQRHPDWSPAAIKSALMTTAYGTADDGLPADYNGAHAFGQGAGHVSPTAAADPGLVYDLGPADYQRFLCGIGSRSVTAELCGQVGTIKDYDLNLASITAANVPDTLSVKRRVTNVGGVNAVYTATASVPGFAVTVAPATLTLAPGASADFSVTLKRTSSQNNVWAFGSLEWSDGTHHVRSPLTARTSLFVAESYLYSEGTSGNKTFGVTTAFNGKLVIKPSGLREAVQETYTLHQNTSSDYGVAECAAGGSDSVSFKRVTIPPGTIAARFALFSSDTVGGPGDDVNLLLLDAKGKLIVGSVRQFTSDESLDTTDPEPGDYLVCAVAAVAATGTVSTKLSSWIVESNASGSGNLKVLAPSTVFAFRPASATMSWSGLKNNAHYVGGLEYYYGGMRLGATLIGLESADVIWASSAGVYLTPRQLRPRAD